MKRWLAAAVLTLLILAGCTSGEDEQGGYQLYFLPQRDTSYGNALVPQQWAGEEDPTADQLMEALLAGPGEGNLLSPFPKGLTLLALEVDEGRGMVRLTLSEQYSGLTDIAQTLADACIVKTLCQLPGVDVVEISTDGFWASRPASRTLREDQLELNSLLP